MAKARNEHNGIEAVLYMAMELSKSSWKLGFTTSAVRPPRIVTVVAGDMRALQFQILRAKERLGLPPEARVMSCYEAGRDGFWIDRFLKSIGIENVIVDPSSIEVSRRKRRAKTDRIDVNGLLLRLIRHVGGEPRVFAMVRVPSVEAEDARQLHRELSVLKSDRTSLVARMKSLMETQGMRLTVGRLFLVALENVRLWDGSAVPPQLMVRFKRDYERLQRVNAEIKMLEGERRTLLKTSDSTGVKKVNGLMGLKAIGVNSAWLFVMEFFAWRTFNNRKEVGGASGLTGTPYNSGDQIRDQGIAKSGNKRVRTMAVEIAWLWLRYQPDSKLTKWFNERFGVGKRMRRVGIVALARRLLIELWRFVEFGVVPEGAEFKA